MFQRLILKSNFMISKFCFSKWVNLCRRYTEERAAAADAEAERLAEEADEVGGCTS